MNDKLIETRGLSKTFGTQRAVDSIDLIVPAGSIVGLAGPNGAGKTTVLKMLLGITRPSEGVATVTGMDAVADSTEIRRRVAFVPEDKLLYDDMTVADFSRFYGSFFDDFRGDAMIRTLDAWQIPRDRRIKDLSKGMRAKLVITAAICRIPLVILMDEPTIDLDPGSVDEVLGLLSNWVGAGDRSVVMATHRLEDVERICDRVCLMEAGRNVLEGNLDDIKSHWNSIEGHSSSLPGEISARPGVRAVSGTGDRFRVVVDADVEKTAAFLAENGATGIDILHMNLREIFLTVTKYTSGRLDDALEGVV